MTSEWAVFDVPQQRVVTSFPTEAKAAEFAGRLNVQENRARRYKKFVVVPLTNSREERSTAKLCVDMPATAETHVERLRRLPVNAKHG